MWWIVVQVDAQTLASIKMSERRELTFVWKMCNHQQEFAEGPSKLVGLIDSNLSDSSPEGCKSTSACTTGDCLTHQHKTDLITVQIIGIVSLDMTGPASYSNINWLWSTVISPVFCWWVITLILNGNLVFGINENEFHWKGRNRKDPVYGGAENLKVFKITEFFVMRSGFGFLTHVKTLFHCEE